MSVEADGWGIIHGIGDSIWVRARPREDQVAIEQLATDLSETVGTRPENEASYDWMCFVPKRGQDTGALTKHFGKPAGEDAYEVRAIMAVRAGTRG